MRQRRVMLRQWRRSALERERGTAFGWRRREINRAVQKGHDDVHICYSSCLAVDGKGDHFICDCLRARARIRRVGVGSGVGVEGGGEGKRQGAGACRSQRPPYALALVQIARPPDVKGKENLGAKKGKKKPKANKSKENAREVVVGVVRVFFSGVGGKGGRRSPPPNFCLCVN